MYHLKHSKLSRLKKFVSRLLIAIILTYPIYNNAQTKIIYDNNLKFENYQKGIPSTFSVDMMLGDNGCLWVHNGVGNVLRYDGYEFKKFNPNKGDLLPKGANRAYNKLIEDNQGYIWELKNTGLLRLNPSTNKTIAIPNKQYLPPGCSLTIPYGIEKDRYGALWVGTFCGLYKITLTKDSFDIKSWGPDTASENIINAADKIQSKTENTIAALLQVGDDVKLSKPFEIKDSSKKVIVINQGESFNFRFFTDYGFIENEDGKIIWIYDNKPNFFAGGTLKNVLQIDTLTLPKGKYNLKYISDDSHSYDDWNAPAPIRPEWWGIQVLEAKGPLYKPLLNALQKESEVFFPTFTYPFMAKDSTLFCAAYNGIYKVHQNGEEDTFELVNNKKFFTTYFTKWAIPGNSGRVWIAAKEGGPWQGPRPAQPTLFSFDSKTYEIEQVKHGLKKDINGGTSSISIMQEDSNGALWLGTYNAGLYKLSPPFINVGDSLGQPNLEYVNVLETQSGEANAGSIISLVEDKEQNIWVGGRGFHLFKIPITKSNISYFDFSKKMNLDFNTYNSDVFLDSKGNTWAAASNNRQVFKIQPDGDIVPYEDNFLGINLKNGALQSQRYNHKCFAPLYEDEENNLWFGGYNMIVKFNPEKNIAKKIPIPLKNTDDEHIDIMVKDNNGNFWIGNSSGSTYLLDPKTERLKLFNEEQKKAYYDAHHISNILKDQTRGVWLIGRDGYLPLQHIELKGEKIDTIYEKFLNVGIYDFKQDSEGNLWFGTMNGLHYLNVKKDTIIKYNDNHGLENPVVWSLQIDDQENIWCNTSSGLYRFDRKAQKFKSFRQLADFVSPDIHSLNRFYKNENGSFTIADKDGILTFYPDSLSTNRRPPIIVINKVITSDLSFEGEYQINTSDFSSLSHDQNDLSLFYQGIGFDNAALQTYAFQLVGVDKDWVNAGGERIARYPNLAPGEYIFKVKAANADGIWSKPKSLKIAIHPPWWQTWWAYALYALIGIGLLWWYIQSLNKKLAREKEFSNKLERINNANQRFVPIDFLQILGKDSIEDLKLGDQTQTKMTVLFSDIRDYTPLSESMTPEENFKFINAYLGRVGPIIKEHGGFISTYLGDGLMALFVNEPKNAAKASIAIQKELNNYNGIRKVGGKRALKTGMGLNTGDLMLGVIGDEHRYESTVISDAVNTASRMEGLTKIFGAAIIISEKTLEGLNVTNIVKNPDTFAYRYLGKVKVKGKDKAIKIYDLYEGETVTIRELKAQTKVQFEEGISNYFNRQFGKSAECFKQVLAINEGDKAAAYYLDKSVGYIVNGVAENWSGVEEMVMK